MQMCFHVSELKTIRNIKCSGLRESWGGQTVMPSKIPNFPRTHKGMDAKDSNSASAELPRIQVRSGGEVPVRNELW